MFFRGLAGETFAPRGRRWIGARQGVETDEGVALRIPSSGLSGHLLPHGEKEVRPPSHSGLLSREPLTAHQA